MKRIYLSHPIRGKKGSRASFISMDTNNNIASAFGRLLESMLNSMHAIGLLDDSVEVYIPADHDKVLSYVWRKNWISIDQLLEADCAILEDCDMLLIYDHEKYLGRGMRIEKEYADHKGIPVVHFQEFTFPVLYEITGSLDA